MMSLTLMSLRIMIMTSLILIMGMKSISAEMVE
jgi:hypothetical protein